MNEKECTSWKEWMKEAYEHDCGNREMSCCDDHSRLMLGWWCLGCNAWFVLKIAGLKQSVPPDMWKFIQTREGRQMLAKTMKRFLIVVEDEVEL